MPAITESNVPKLNHDASAIGSDLEDRIQMGWLSLDPSELSSSGTESPPGDFPFMTAKRNGVVREESDKPGPMNDTKSESKSVGKWTENFCSSLFSSGKSALSAAHKVYLEFVPSAVFRMLLVGARGAGKSTFINAMAGVTVTSESRYKSGQHDIEHGITLESLPDFVFHECEGMHAADGARLKVIQDFIGRSTTTSNADKRLNLIMYLVALPVYGAGDLFDEQGDVAFLHTDFHHTPVLVVFTKFNCLLDEMMQKVYDDSIDSGTFLSLTGQFLTAYELAVHEVEIRGLGQLRASTSPYKEYSVVGMGPECKEVYLRVLTHLEATHDPRQAESFFRRWLRDTPPTSLMHQVVIAKTLELLNADILTRQREDIDSVAQGQQERQDALLQLRIANRCDTEDKLRLSVTTGMSFLPTIVWATVCPLPGAAWAAYRWYASSMFWEMSKNWNINMDASAVWKNASNLDPSVYYSFKLLFRAAFGAAAFGAGIKMMAGPLALIPGTSIYEGPMMARLVTKTVVILTAAFHSLWFKWHRILELSSARPKSAAGPASAAGITSSDVEEALKSIIENTQMMSALDKDIAKVYGGMSGSTWVDAVKSAASWRSFHPAVFFNPAHVEALAQTLTERYIRKPLPIVKDESEYIARARQSSHLRS